MTSRWRHRCIAAASLAGIILFAMFFQNSQISVKNWLGVLTVSQQEWNWKASALVREHLRFVVSLESYVNQSEERDVEFEDVLERFDLYWSRYTAMNTFFADSDAKTIKLLSGIASSPDDVERRIRAVVDTLNEQGIATLESIEPSLLRLKVGDVASYISIMQKLKNLSDLVVELETALFKRSRLLQFTQIHLTETLDRRLRIAYFGLSLIAFTLFMGVYAYVIFKNRAARSLESMNSQLRLKVAESESLAQELKLAASHDSLTGLLNRHGFEQLLDGMFLEPGQTHGLCFVDLDMFKVVNDTGGHVAGDRLIQEVASLFLGEFGSQGQVARFGGDEFILVWPQCEARDFRESIVAVCDKLSPYRFQFNQHHFEISGSFGALHFRAGDHSAQSVMTIADAACYKAKNSGGGRVHFHDGDDSIMASRQSDLFWINAIQAALNEDRFVLFHQPIVEICLEGGERPHGWEILIRMSGLDGNIVPPGHFLDVAERYGLAPRIDRWVVQQAFDWLNRNPVDLIGLDCLNINLSGLSVSDLEFLAFIEELTRQANFDPASVCFELTETAVAGAQSRQFLLGLKAMGYQLALDDFGSGFASFGYLETLPVDYIKIDGQFVKDVDTNPTHREFVNAIGTIGRAMGKKVVAEFVENAASLEILRELGIDFAQGYHLAKPSRLPDDPARPDSLDAVA